MAKKLKTASVGAASSHFSIFSYVVILLLLAGSVANLGLSFYIESQKRMNEQKILTSIDDCFLLIQSDPLHSGCATVQTSVYANAFGFSNPLVGIFVFSALSVAFWMLFLSRIMSGVARIVDALGKWLDRAIIAMLAGGSLFSLWLLYVQFFLLQTTCKYCLWVDGIMLGMGLLYLLCKDFVWSKE